jgi:hypothetical protein
VGEWDVVGRTDEWPKNDQPRWADERSRGVFIESGRCAGL